MLSRRTRIILSILVVASLTFVILDLRGGDGPFSSARAAVSSIIGGIQRGAATIFSPITGSSQWWSTQVGQSGQIRELTAENERLNSQALAVGGQLISLHGLRGDYCDLFLPLFGEHQANNAAVALAACETFLGSALLAPLDIDAVREGFAKVTSPGRLEILRTGPTVMVDAAHNPHGAKSLAAALENSFTFVGVIAVLGMLTNKDAVGFLEAIAPVVSQVIVTEPNSPRALPASELARLAIEVLGDERVIIGGDLMASLVEAIRLADGTGEYGGVGIVVTGSVVLVGDTIRLLTQIDSKKVK